MTFEEWFAGVYPAQWLENGSIDYVLKDLKDAWNAAVEAEREACAKACEDQLTYDEYDPGKAFAAAIRARSKP